MSVSCQSLTSQLIKVTGDFVQSYQDFRESAAKIFVNTIIPGKAGSEAELNKLIEQAFDLQNDLLNTYDKLTKHGGGKIGARHLTIPTKKVTGDLVIERTFIVTPSPYDKVTVVIKKTGGKAGANIAICAKHPNGDPYDRKDRSLKKGKEATGEAPPAVFTDMASKAITIHLVKTGFPTDTCDYSISIEGEFDQKEMQNLASKSKGITAVRASAT